jgi:UDP-2,3-diacylglucosamine pyrophosphatase LpxH
LPRLSRARWCALAIGYLCLTGTSWAQDGGPAVAQVNYTAPSGDEQRLTVFISDLHFGVGKGANGKWNPTEDFRWPKALRGFVDKISEMGSQRTDLVIVGDFLELWQPPAPCKGQGADAGCTIDEMAALSKLVAGQHKDDLAILKDFASRGENRLHVIVGNHDSTLRYANVWEPVGKALAAESGRIELVTSGVWESKDGRIVAEHGHQIGEDVNKYATWPDIARRVNGKDYIVRPWGELFVQRLFNAQEADYPIIDNLSPETAGAKIRAADRGFWGSAADIAKLITFNLLETSLRQKIATLGEPPTGPITWNVEVARGMGASLLLFALPADDPMRKQIKAAGPAAKALLAEMTALVQDPGRLPAEEIQQICDLVAINEPDHKCWDKSLGALAQNLLESKAKVMAKHIRGRLPDHKSMQLLVYGHTHQFEMPWVVKLEGGIEITVANTGAFQRLIDEVGFMARLKKRTPVEALKTMDLAELPPCYTAVLVPGAGENADLAPEVKAWRMDENGQGGFVPADKCK